MVAGMTRDTAPAAFAARLTRSPIAFDAEAGRDAARAFADLPPDVVALIGGAAGCSPYLKGLMTREAAWLRVALNGVPEEVLADLLRAIGLVDAAALTLAPDAALHSVVAERVARAQAMLRAVGARGVPQLVVKGQGGALRLIGGDALLGPREKLVEHILGA